MRFLFALPHAGYLRNFESTLTLLSERGHDIVLALGSAGKPALREPERRLAELEAAQPRLSVTPGIERLRAFRKEDRRGRELRSWLDYLRYFDAAFARAGRLRERAAEAVSPRMIEITREAAAKPGGVEAVRLHGVARERIAVIGSPLHDVWFDSEPATSRAELCARAGLADDRPYLLYEGSSPHVAPAEQRWIARWATKIRAAGDDDV